MKNALLALLALSSAASAALSFPGTPVLDNFMRTKRHPSLAQNWIDYFAPLPGGAESVDVWNGSTGWYSVGVAGNVVVSGGNFNLSSTMAATIAGKADTTALASYATLTNLSTGLSGKFDVPVGSTGQYLRGDGSVATFPTLVSAFTNDAGYSTSAALSSGLAGKEPTITAGTTAQYWRGDKTWQTFPTDLSSFANGPAYITASALSPYLTTATAASTYATQASLTSGLAGKFNTPAGTTAQYLRGDGSAATFPTSNSSFTNGAGYLVASDLSPYLTSSAAAAAYSPLAHTHTFASLTSKPTTLSGYGITDAYPLTGNPGAFLTSISSGDVTAALGFTPYNATNPAGYTTNVGTVTSVSGTAPISVATGTTTPVISISAASGAAAGSMSAADFTKLAGVASGATANTGTVTSVGLTSSNLTVTGSPVTTSGTLTVALPATGTAGTYNTVTTDALGRVTAGAARSLNGTPGRSIVTTTSSTGFQIDAAQDAAVTYDIDLSSTASIAGNASVTVFLETAATNSTTPGDWTTVAKVANGQALSLAITLQSVQTTTYPLTRVIAAGKYVRLRSLISGTASATIAYSQEVKL